MTRLISIRVCIRLRYIWIYLSQRRKNIYILFFLSRFIYTYIFIISQAF